MICHKPTGLSFFTSIPGVVTGVFGLELNYFKERFSRQRQEKRKQSRREKSFQVASDDFQELKRVVN